MLIRRGLLLTTTVVSVLAAGCVSTTLKTYVDPSIQAGSIRSVAIFPMRNARLLPDESREINRAMCQAFLQQNPNVAIVGPAQSVDLLGRSGLSDEYSNFLRNYAMSGIPNVTILKKIGDHLGVHALLQGELSNVRQADGVPGRRAGKTSLAVRYALLSAGNGDIVWEATSHATKTTLTFIQPAPPLYDVILLAQKKILSALPTLGGQEQRD